MRKVLSSFALQLLIIWLAYLAKTLKELIIQSNPMLLIFYISLSLDGIDFIE